MDRSVLNTLSYLASAPRGLADLLVRELTALGAEDVRERGPSVVFRGDLAVGYRACLRARTASRVLLEIATFSAATVEEYYAALRAIDWQQHVDPAGTLACDFSGRHPAIANTHFGALKLKDAICDQLRAATGRRLDISLDRPGVKVHAHANGAQFSISIDFAGEGLHRRGWRTEAGEAPLRENVAAGLLLRAGWERMAEEGAEFLDPMCGSGTLVIEAASIATRRASGLLRPYFGFFGWRGHDPSLWQSLVDEARANEQRVLANVIRGSDRDARVLQIARANAVRAGVGELVQFEHTPVSSVVPRSTAPGLVCVNPPYGVRLEDAQGAEAAYRELGRVLRAHFAGWEAAILTATPEASRALQLRNYRTHDIDNGAIPCRLLRIDLSDPGTVAPADPLSDPDPQIAQSAGAQMFANRLGKNLRNLGREARRAQVSCYRLYDADMPEYALAIDRYEESGTALPHLYVQEYAPPSSIDPQAARRRRAEAFSTLVGTAGVPAERIHLRVRQRQRGASQYEAQDEQGAFLTVAEGGLKFRVNFTDYLDTGLFLDHRLVRARLRELAAGKRFLNLFCYTATASVYAAAGGAAHSVSVDLSNTYLDWAGQNFLLNGMQPAQHELVRADCRAWLDEAVRRGRAFDLIFCDPPTFSNSKRMAGVLDTQRDHPQLIEQCMQLLAPGGVLVFSTNAQRFRLDPALSGRYAVQDVSARSLPFDFARNPNIHRCYELFQTMAK
ncbi:MAG: bifunctional 23S rRNA (guanine(2069)-N(7))-methyltransferase RlmK/23S rRNA (guanine(2445)-N(2))-methyltransferase RlmL [Steroidobacteraceae bacterium]